MNDFANSPEPRRRGRPPRNPQSVEATEEPNPRSQMAETKRRRRRRSDFGESRNLKLAVPESAKDPSYHYRWVTDTNGGRIRNFTVDDDWEIVSDKAIDSHGEGTSVARHTGTAEGGSSQRAYLLRKPKEFHEEDQREKWAKLDKIDQSMRQGSQDHSNGLEPDKAYVPQGHTNRFG